jgi:demethylmenaquinone methyltransferase / 2-methoxy-6-polyprenyl-1,4-benzoquinol methylase
MSSPDKPGSSNGPKTAGRPGHNGASAVIGAAAGARADQDTGARSGNFLPESRVTAMFDAIAPVYDRMNTLMTAGLDDGWRRKAVKASGVERGGSALDVACGTGRLTFALAAVAGPEGRVVGLDLSPAMLVEAHRASGDRPGVEFELGNALALPFPDGSFDAATIAFGMRNLASFEAGFAEMARVVKSGGRVVCLELSTPRPRWFGRLYINVFRVFAPTLGTLFGRRSAYAYLPHSLDGFPDPREIAQTMRRAGLRDIGVKRLALGAVALHVGTVAEKSGPAK